MEILYLIAVESFKTVLSWCILIRLPPSLFFVFFHEEVSLFRGGKSCRLDLVELCWHGTIRGGYDKGWSKHSSLRYRVRLARHDKIRLVLARPCNCKWAHKGGLFYSLIVFNNLLDFLFNFPNGSIVLAWPRNHRA